MNKAYLQFLPALSGLAETKLEKYCKLCGLPNRTETDFCDPLCEKMFKKRESERNK